MAFQDFDYISERRRNERKQRLKKRIIIAVVSIICVGLIVAGAVCAFVYKNKQDNNNAQPKKNGGGGGSTKTAASSKSPPPPAKDDVKTMEKAVKMICEPTDYKQACEDSLTKEVASNNNSFQPKDLIKAAISVTSAELVKAINETSKFNFETPEAKGAYEDCTVLLADALEELNSSISGVDDASNLAKLSTPDLNNWLSAVMSYQQTCVDGFPEGELRTSLQKAFNSTQEFTSNALAILSQASSILSTFKNDPPAAAAKRNLLSQDEDGLPSWLTQEDRRMLKAQPKKLDPNAVVAKDGSGNFTTINEALAAIPEQRQGRYVIYVKEGIYEEYVTVTKKMVNITMYGDGSQKTIVTGNKNFVDGVRTFQTATFAALGEGFMAQSMGFRNTAGPEKHQAVALRVQSDRSIFLNCRMEAYQDTLYAQTHRQFYRSCLITGTVDFIFGDAAAVFQNCVIYARKPMENQQNIVTAQGRIDKHQTTGIVLQKCRILADDTLEPVKANFKSYLGRPWKEYSRTIVMESEIGDLIHPDGWLPWQGEFALSTLYYAEYNNEGPGSPVTARVKWPGYKVIDKEEAAKFTIGPFLQGDSWLNVPDLPVHFGLF